MYNTPMSNRMHIGIFGRMNVGKSTLINSITNQEIAITSDKPGTTTDPVYKAMEIHELGPITLIDTGGIDDISEIGKKRVEKAYNVLNKTDISILVIDKRSGFGKYEEYFLNEVKRKKIPFIVVVNKIDITNENKKLINELIKRGIDYIEASALKNIGIDKIRDKIPQIAPEDFERKVILKDMLNPDDVVVLVAPLDIEAPKGRLKLAQVQTIRDTLDTNCTTIIAKENSIKKILSNLKSKPKLVITESQVLDKVKDVIPNDIPLTTFSILYARYKGDLKTLINGIKYLDKIKENDKILIAEACTHHPVGDDIGRVVIPNLLKSLYKGKKFCLNYCAGYDFPKNVDEYKLIIHCGGCMLNRREMLNRINNSKLSDIPITNYGLFIAYCHGAFDRVIAPFNIHTKSKIKCSESN